MDVKNLIRLSSIPGDIGISFRGQGVDMTVVSTDFHSYILFHGCFHLYDTGDENNKNRKVDKYIQLLTETTKNDPRKLSLNIYTIAWKFVDKNNENCFTSRNCIENDYFTILIMTSNKTLLNDGFKNTLNRVLSFSSGFVL